MLCFHLVQGSRFRVQGSRGGFAAFFRRWYSRIVKANTGYVEKKNNDGQSLPLEGKVASGASRIGFWRCEKERGDRLKCAVCESTLSTAARSPFPNGEGNETRIPLFSHCQNKCMHMWKNNIDGQSLPQWGRLRNGDTAIPISLKRIQDMWRKTIPTDKAFPAWGRWRAERAG